MASKLALFLILSSLFIYATLDMCEAAKMNSRRLMADAATKTVSSVKPADAVPKTTTLSVKTADPVPKTLGPIPKKTEAPKTGAGAVDVQQKSKLGDVDAKYGDDTDEGNSNSYTDNTNGFGNQNEPRRDDTGNYGGTTRNNNDGYGPGQTGANDFEDEEPTHHDPDEYTNEMPDHTGSTNGQSINDPDQIVGNGGEDFGSGSGNHGSTDTIDPEYNGKGSTGEEGIGNQTNDDDEDSEDDEDDMGIKGGNGDRNSNTVRNTNNNGGFNGGRRNNGDGMENNMDPDTSTGYGNGDLDHDTNNMHEGGNQNGDITSNGEENVDTHDTANGFGFSGGGGVDNKAAAKTGQQVSTAATNPPKKN